MDSQQLVDALAAHAALYHWAASSSSPSPANTATVAPRAAILRWFAALPVTHRQAAVTSLHADLLRALLAMLARLRARGPSLFFLLPDLPSSSSMPSLLSRRSCGLLSRSIASDPHAAALFRSVLFFSSRESEDIAGCPLDSITVIEDFVADVDGFVEIMDGITGGRFLRGEVEGLCAPWVEMDWLKDMGYFSVEAFLANRIEVALRLSWIGNNKGKKGKAGKGKEVAAATVVAGAAANAFWRKKGCVDWWVRLEPGLRKRMLVAFLGKAAKFLVNDIGKGLSTFDVENNLSRGHQPTKSMQMMKQSIFNKDPDLCVDFTSFPYHGRSPTVADCLNRLVVVREISSMFLKLQQVEFQKDALFFSTSSSADSVSDFIWRKLRGLIMIVFTDNVKLELIGNTKHKTLPNKSKDKLGVTSQKGKKCHKSKKECASDAMESNSSGFCSQEKATPLAAKKPTTSVSMTVVQDETQLHGNDMGHSKGLVDCKGRVNKKKSGRKRTKKKTTCLKEPIEVGNLVTGNQKVSVSSIFTEPEEARFLTSLPSSNVVARDEQSPKSTSDASSKNPDEMVESETSKGDRMSDCFPSCSDCSFGGSICHPCSNIPEEVDKHALQFTSKDQWPSHSSTISLLPNICSDKLLGNHGSTSGCESGSIKLITLGSENAVKNKEFEDQNFQLQNSATSVSVSPLILKDNSNGTIIQNTSSDQCVASFIGGMSNEWPYLGPLHFASPSSQSLPTATDRLHLDVSQKLPNHHRSFLPRWRQVQTPSMECGQSRVLPSLALPMSFDWPPMVKSYNRLSQTVMATYDSGYTTRLPYPYSGFVPHRMQINGSASVNERKPSWDIVDVYDSKVGPEFTDDSESYWLSEEESETHAMSARDYNQFFGGGVMYWNSSEHAGTGFSRPPSYSSEDSSWAWREAELNRTIDDMVGMPGLSASYTNGLASPPAAPFCSPFDSLGTGHHAGKAVSAVSSIADLTDDKLPKSVNNLPSGVEGMKGDPLPYPVLRPIIVPTISRKGSRSEFIVSSDHKSPCIPSTISDSTRIKRPPSPVVLCVPRVPRPPPPSPVGESRKRGFPIVRSGSSSPRHWGMRSWYHDENPVDSHLSSDGPEVVWPPWGNKGLSSIPMVQSIQGSLLQDHLISVSALAGDQEHPDVALPLQPPHLLHSPNKMPLSMLHSVLHDEIDSFSKQVAAEHLIRKPYINWAVKRVARSLQVLWPRSRTNVFGSSATGLALPSSDVDLVVCLPPVRNLEPIKEAGILEGRNGIKETCLQHAARYLGNQEWVRNDSIKTIENTAIPVIMLVVEVPHDVIFSNGNSSSVDTLRVRSIKELGEHGIVSHSDESISQNTSLPSVSKFAKGEDGHVELIHLDISFKSPSHTGLQTTELVRELSQQFPAVIPLALVLKQFLADRSLDDSYSGGLSSYCLVLLVTRFLQHEHHVAQSMNQSLGSLLMDFLYFFGHVFDPRQMRISIHGSGVYMKRERGLSFDPIHIDDPLYPSNNVGRNCFRIHQCVKAFAEAYTMLENELSQFSEIRPPAALLPFTLLHKIIPSIGQGRQRSMKSS